MDIELWQPIAGYEGSYEVSNYGRIRTLKGIISTTGTDILTPCGAGKDRMHLQVALSSNNTSSRYYVARLVAQAYLPGYDGQFVRYFDGNPTNCVASNLYYTVGSWLYHQTGSYNREPNARHHVFNELDRIEF